MNDLENIDINNTNNTNTNNIITFEGLPFCNDWEIINTNNTNNIITFEGLPFCNNWDKEYISKANFTYKSLSFNKVYKMINSQNEIIFKEEQTDFPDILKPIQEYIAFNTNECKNLYHVYLLNQFDLTIYLKSIADLITSYCRKKRLIILDIKVKLMTFTFIFLLTYYPDIESILRDISIIGAQIIHTNKGKYYTKAYEIYGKSEYKPSLICFSNDHLREYYGFTENLFVGFGYTHEYHLLSTIEKHIINALYLLLQNSKDSPFYKLLDYLVDSEYQSLEVIIKNQLYIRKMYYNDIILNDVLNYIYEHYHEIKIQELPHLKIKQYKKNQKIKVYNSVYSYFEPLWEPKYHQYMRNKKGENDYLLYSLVLDPFLIKDVKAIILHYISCLSLNQKIKKFNLGKDSSHINPVF